MAEPGRDGKPRRRSRRGRGEESDGCTVPVKPRTKPTTNRWRRWWREGGRPEGRRAATHAPDSVPDTACNRSCEPADWGCMGRQSPEPQSRSTFGRSPVRESRTPGSARGGRGNPVPYRYKILKTRTRSNTIKEMPDIKTPSTKTAVSGVVEKLKIPSKASSINLCSGYFVTPAARGSRS